MIVEVALLSMPVLLLCLFFEHLTEIALSMVLVLVALSMDTVVGFQAQKTVHSTCSVLVDKQYPVETCKAQHGDHDQEVVPVRC